MGNNVNTYDMMANEVYTVMKSPKEFDLQLYRGAFATVAHRHGIWHHQYAPTYNRYFKQVMDRVKNLIQNPRGLQPVTPSATLTPPPTHVYHRQYVDNKMLAAGDYDD